MMAAFWKNNLQQTWEYNLLHVILPMFFPDHRTISMHSASEFSCLFPRHGALPEQQQEKKGTPTTEVVLRFPRDKIVSSPEDGRQLRLFCCVLVQEYFRAVYRRVATFEAARTYKTAFVLLQTSTRNSR
jgi:hypothetical protein